MMKGRKRETKKGLDEEECRDSYEEGQIKG
jgi:hypothetical protein